MDGPTCLSDAEMQNFREICVKDLLPELSDFKYKGQNGKVLVVGGSRDFAGAPYFAAMAALRLGADMVHVVCPPEAAVPIKSYSPDLMVHASLPSTLSASSSKELASSLPLKDILARVDSIVLGPGLGLDTATHNATRTFFKYSRENKIPIVVDADGLTVVANDPSLVAGNPLCVLTPNVAEFERLIKIQKLPPMVLAPTGTDQAVEAKRRLHQVTSRCQSLSDSLKVTVLVKGPFDVICAPRFPAYVCGSAGARKRCGGQGDILSGCVGAMLAWERLRRKSQPSATGGAVGGGSSSGNPRSNSRPTTATVSSGTETDGDEQRLTSLAALCAADLTRTAANAAFLAARRSLITSDILQSIATAFENLYPSAGNQSGEDANKPTKETSHSGS